jgi:hypothetical protein
MEKDDVRYKRAIERVEEIKGFYIHLFIYIVVNVALFLLNLSSSPGRWWFYWPFLGWGIGLLGHAVGVFGLGKFFGAEWEERKIKEIMEKQETKNDG